MSAFRAQEVQQRVAASSEPGSRLEYGPADRLVSELRHDTGQRDAVAHGIATLIETGVMPAVEYLKSQGVRAAVIERVLLEPARRRA